MTAASLLEFLELRLELFDPLLQGMLLLAELELADRLGRRFRHPYIDFANQYGAGDPRRYCDCVVQGPRRPGGSVW